MIKWGEIFIEKKGDKRKFCIRCEYKFRSINYRESLYYWFLFIKNDSFK